MNKKIIATILFASVLLASCAKAPEVSEETTTAEQTTTTEETTEVTTTTAEETTEETSAATSATTTTEATTTAASEPADQGDPEPAAVITPANMPYDASASEEANLISIILQVFTALLRRFLHLTDL